MRYYLILSFFLLSITSVFGQGWQRNLGTPNRDHVADVKQTNDGGYIITGYTSTSPTNVHYDLYLIKTDVNGHKLWDKKYGGSQREKGFAVQPTTDGGYIVAGSTYSYGAGSFDVYLVKTDANGDSLWTKFYGDTGLDEARSIQQASDQGYFIFGSTRKASTTTTSHFSDMYLIRTDLNGDTLWTKKYGTDSTSDYGRFISPTSDGGYIMTGYDHTNADVRLIKIDSSGQTLWAKSHSALAPLKGNEVYETRDSGYIISGHTAFSGFAHHLLIKTDSNGDTLWTKNYGKTLYDPLLPASSVKETSDGGFILIKDYYQELQLIKTDALGQEMWTKTHYAKNNDDHGIKVILNAQNGYTFIYYALGTLGASYDIFLAKTDSLGRFYSNQMVGNVYQDNNANCLFDTLIDYNLSNIIIKAEHQNTGQLFYATTDSTGHYSTEIDSGIYTVQIAQNLPYHYYNCQLQLDTITFDTFYQSKTSNFTLTPLVQCPLLYVDISAPFLRQTNMGSYYTISYCNNGTSLAQNPYVEVDLDPNLTILSSSIPIHNQVNNTYRFNLSNIDLGDCGSFQIQVIGDTSSIAGQTICTEVHIYPDSICLPNTWNGPILNASAQCLNDTIYFKVRNKGAAMSVGNTYYVYEDNIMLRTGSTNPLGTNATQQIIQPAAQGRTYRFEVEQNVNFPALLGDSITSASVAGCNVLPGGLFNTSFLTQFSNGSSAPFEAIDCQPLLTSYDPNDKSAQPVGYGNNHYIYDYIALDYKIRFQNTGTDTAFRVVIRDTLSSYLDPASIQMGASSHNYTWRVYGSNILEVTFDNILLPDSTTNELASNGFFRFRIAQQTANPLGSIIYNNAAIYFDYNAPIITNETFHTISDHFVVIQLLGTEDILTKDISNIKVYPNPFEKQSTIEIIGKTYHHLELRIYDLTGKLVQQQSSTGNQFIIQRQQLEAGMYLYQLEGDQELLNTGKLIVR